MAPSPRPDRIWLFDILPWLVAPGSCAYRTTLPQPECDAPLDTWICGGGTLLYANVSTMAC